MPVTIKDIADKLNISRATVSMALNNRPGVNAQTRQRVLDLVEEMQYEMKTSKNTINQTRLISFVVYKTHGKVVSNTEFFTELIQAVEQNARKLNYSVTISYCMGGDEVHKTLESLRASQPEGLLLLGTEMSTDGLDIFKGLEIPMVLLDCDLYDSGCDKVLINNQEGVRQAVKYLFNHGHRQIGYLHSSQYLRNFEQREEGWRAAMKEFQLLIEDQFILPLSPTVDGAYEDMQLLLENNHSLPTAFFADNDIIAFGAVKAMKQNGYRIPDDISIVGFDDVSLGALMEPRLTTIAVPRLELGGIAVKQLVRKFTEENEAYVKICVDTSLLERESVNTK